MIYFTEIKIFNEIGEKVYGQNDLICKEYEVNTDIKSGTYLVQIKTFDGTFINRKIVVL